MVTLQHLHWLKPSKVEQQMEHNKDSLCTYAVEYLQPAPPHSSRSAQGKGKMSLSIQHDV